MQMETLLLIVEAIGKVRSFGGSTPITLSVPLRECGSPVRRLNCASPGTRLDRRTGVRVTPRLSCSATGLRPAVPDAAAGCLPCVDARRVNDALYPDAPAGIRLASTGSLRSKFTTSASEEFRIRTSRQQPTAITRPRLSKRRGGGQAVRLDRCQKKPRLYCQETRPALHRYVQRIRHPYQRDGGFDARARKDRLRIR